MTDRGHCKDCRWHEPGRCKRRAPSTLVLVDKGEQYGRPYERTITQTHWPLVQMFDWCGDFERKEGA